MGKASECVAKQKQSPLTRIDSCGTVHSAQQFPPLIVRTSVLLLCSGLWLYMYVAQQRRITNTNLVKSFM